MELLAYILLAFFVGLVLFVAMSLGFALLAVCLMVTFLVAAWMLLRQSWYRWRFLSAARNEPPRVIEGDYEDVSHREQNKE